MRFQAAELCERVAADVACKRPLAAVRLDVDLEVAGQLEAPAAQAAAVGPLHRVVLLVREQVADGADLMVAPRARVREGRRVRLQVFAKRLLAGFGGVAHDARQGAGVLVPRVGVHCILVQLQGALLDEALAAGVAGEGPLTGVHALVVLQGVALVEALAAKLTPERLLPSVYADVALQVAR